MSGPVLLYDGECPLCNRTVSLLLKLDNKAVLRLSPQQSPSASQLAAAFEWSFGGDNTNEGKQPDYEQVWLATSEGMYTGAHAALKSFMLMGGAYGTLARVLSLLPNVLLNAGYGLIARNRKKFLTPYVCNVPLDRMWRLPKELREAS